MWPLKKRPKYPPAINRKMVGNYPALAKSGAGYFYDEVLEYRVWIHPEAGGKDLHDGDDYFFAFETYEEALSFSRHTRGAEQPLVLIRQLEHVDEPGPGQFMHVKGERIAEWKPEWLPASKREPDSIEMFLKKHNKA